MSIRTNSILRDESGAALVIALIMMIVLTLVGLASVSTSIFEIKISGNKRGSTDAFYGADSGIQATMANVGNFTLTRYGADNRYVDVLDDPANANLNPTDAYIVMIHDTTQSGAPRGSGMGTHVDFIHFLVSSTAQDRMEASLIKSTCSIEQKVVRIIPASE